MRTSILCCAAAWLCAGCNVPTEYSTPSGRPEITISGRVGKQALAAMAGEMVNRRYTIRQQTDTILVCERIDTSLQGTLIYGSSYDGRPAGRATWNAIEGPDTTRLVGTFCMVTNPGSAFERITPVTSPRSTAAYLPILENIKARLEAPAK